MKIDIIDMDKFVEMNKCPRVTNIVSFNSDGTPTADGLFSYELFGMEPEARRSIFGYIDLGRPFIHPAIYAVMRGRMGNVKKVLSGEMYASLDPFGRIVITKDEVQGSETGIDFFYNNFGKIKWTTADDGDDGEEDSSDIGSLDKETRLKLFKKLSKNEFFCTKWLILPPGYRDISPDSSTMGDDINKLYKKLLGYARTLSGGSMFSFTGLRTQLNIQATLYEIFEATTKLIRGKNTIFREYILGKNIDYSASSVITAYDYTAVNKPSDIKAGLGQGEFPLASVISMFWPIVKNQIMYKLERIYNSCLKYFPEYSLKYEKAKITPKLAENMMKLFIKSPELRFSYVELDAVSAMENKVKAPIPILRVLEVNGKPVKIEDYLTVAEMVYICAYESCSDMHAYVTRYPVENFQNIYPTKININTTVKRSNMNIYLRDGGNKPLPDTLFEKPMATTMPTVLTAKTKPYVKAFDAQFIDVFKPGSSVLESLGGDYDGDVLFMKGVYSKEANDEAERLIKSKTNLFLGEPKLSRSMTRIGMEALLSLYELTKL